jgi:hypothetical protein
VVGVHADRFKDNAVFVVVVLHPPQFVRIPTALRAFPDLGREVFHSVAEVIFEVLFGGDVTP